MRRRFLALFLPPTLWLAAFMLVPTALVAAAAFSPDGFATLKDPLTLRMLGRSTWIALAATALCLAAGYPVAYFIAGCSPGRRNLLLFLVVLPFWTNLLVRTYALMFVLRPLEIESKVSLVVFALFHGYLPFMVLPLYASIEKLPRRLLEASQDLGASPAATFWKVTVPLTMPGIAAGCILVFIPVLGAFAIPEVISGGTVQLIGNQIDLHFGTTNTPAAGAMLTLVLMAATLLLTGLYFRSRKTEGLV